MELRERKGAFWVGLFLAFGLVLLLVALFIFIFPKFNPRGERYTIDFQEKAFGLSKGTAVLCYGVQVGHVLKVGLDYDALAVTARSPDDVSVSVEVRIYDRFDDLIEWTDDRGGIIARLEIPSLLGGQRQISLEFVDVEGWSEQILSDELVGRTSRTERTIASRRSIMGNLASWEESAFETMDGLKDSFDNVGILLGQLRGTVQDLQRTAQAVNQLSLLLDENPIAKWRLRPSPIPGENGGASR